MVGECCSSYSARSWTEVQKCAGNVKLKAWRQYTNGTTRYLIRIKFEICWIYWTIWWVLIQSISWNNKIFLTFRGPCIISYSFWYTRWFKNDRDCLHLFTHKSIPVIFEPPCISNEMQHYTVYLFLENRSTCFGWYLHSSSGAHTTVFTVSGTC